MKRTALLAILVGFLFTKAFASRTEVGNGGDLIACDGTYSKKAGIFSLDFYEAMTLSSNIVNETWDAADEWDNAARAVRVVANVDIHLAEALTAHLNRFRAFAVWETQPLYEVSDTSDLELPFDCHLKQGAIQYNAGGEVDLHISLPLWRQLDTANRTALLLHEAVYTEAIRSGQTNSKQVRKFVGELLQNTFSHFSTLFFDPISYDSFMRSLNLEAPQQ